MNTKIITLIACLVLLLHTANSFSRLENQLVDMGRLATIGLQVAKDAYTLAVNSSARCKPFDRNSVRIDKQVVIITGANAGIGYETALDLAARGGKIYMACRNMRKAKLARQKIIDQLNDTNVIIIIMRLDLESFSSIRKFAQDFKNMETKLNILINNAGVMAIPRRETTENGLEKQIGTNHFGHFLLTNLLVDLMIATAKVGDRARIITLSSVAHIPGKMDFNDLQLLNSYKPWKAYSQSKLANILFTRALSKRLLLLNTNVTANSLNPGVVNTALYRYMGILAFPLKIIMKTPKEGALTTIQLAIDPNLDGVTGKYFADCKIAIESMAAQNIDDSEELWIVGKEIVKRKAFLERLSSIWDL